jgi:CHAT domain-containing protein
LGAVTKGDGVIGLTRAFAVAGANRVQVTLWQVDDAGTRDFMLAVYGKVVKSGKSFGAAISETKREFIASKDYADPWYWSPFVLYGN